MNNLLRFILTDESNGLLCLLRGLTRDADCVQGRIDEVSAMVQDLVAQETVQPELIRLISFVAGKGIGSEIPDKIACAAWLAVTGQTQELMNYAAGIWASRAAHYAQAEACNRGESSEVVLQAFYQAWGDTEAEMLDLYDSIS